MTTPDLSERTTEFALRVIRMTRALPHDPVSEIIGKQILRSSTSIGANYREAARSRSRAEFLAKLGDCLKEADETAYWMDLLDRSNSLPSAKLADLRAECDELIAILVASVKTTRRHMEEQGD